MATVVCIRGHRVSCETAAGDAARHAKAAIEKADAATRNGAPSTTYIRYRPMLAAISNARSRHRPRHAQHYAWSPSVAQTLENVLSAGNVACVSYRFTKCPLSSSRRMHRRPCQDRAHSRTSTSAPIASLWHHTTGHSGARRASGLPRNASPSWSPRRPTQRSAQRSSQPCLPVRWKCQYRPRNEARGCALARHGGPVKTRRDTGHSRLHGHHRAP